MRDTYRRVFAISLAMLACIVLAAILFGWLGGHGSGTDPGDGLPRDPSAREELKRQFDQQSAQQAANGGPKLSLTGDQLAGWTTAWNRMRDCAQRHGFDGVQPVPPTFGDGKTPAPAIQMTPAGASAMSECRFDTSLFDAAKIAQAMDQAGKP
jgi:hypothetical protein